MSAMVTMDWQSLNAPMKKQVQRWGREPEYHLGRLKAVWNDVANEPWMKRIEFSRIDAERRLHVTVPHASALRMELGHRGDRWKQLFEAVRHACDYEISDLVIGDTDRRNTWRRTPRE